MKSEEPSHGAAVVTVVRVPEDSRRFQGHFPDAPIFPAIATLCDVVLPSIRSAWPDLVRVSAVRRMKLPGPIRPGAVLTIKLRRPPESARVDFVVLREETTCAQGTVHFRVPA